MINLVVWSKDRAAQLHLLFESIERFAKNTFRTSVIFTSSDSKYREGYERVMSEFSKGDFLFVDEQNWWEDTYARISTPREKYVCFSTDDTVLYRELPKRIDNIITPDVCTFSLRYGLNTTLQNYHTGEYQPSLVNYLDEGECVSWRFSDYHPHSNYGYPFGLDMHVFKKDLIYKLIKRQELKNTNELESYLFHCKNYAPPMIRSFKESVAVNIPVNSISGVTRAGETFNSPTSYLNEQYLDGKKIDLDAITKEKIIGSHQEIELKWLNGT